MIYKEVESLLTANSHEDILEQLQNEFQTLEEFASKLKDSELDGNVITEIMQKSNGIWDGLKIVHSVVDTFKKHKELRFFHTKKMEIETAKDKVNVSALEKESSLEVANERRVRNIVEAYLAMADKNISTGQSILKKLTDQKRINTQES